MTINFPTLLDADYVHNLILKESGGKSGYLNKGALDSVLHHIQEYYYPNFEDKVTYLFFGIAKGHCFVDGNKRTAIALSYKMLIDNDIFFHRYIDFMEDIAVAVVENKISRDFLKEILIAIINHDLDEKEWLLLAINEVLDK